MIELTRDLIDAIHEAMRTEHLAFRKPWKVGVAPGEALGVGWHERRTLGLLTKPPDGGLTEVSSIWGLPVLVDERVPRGAIALVSQAGAVVAPISPNKEA